LATCSSVDFAVNLALTFDYFFQEYLQRNILVITLPSSVFQEC